jgi:hypothetical protein
MDEDHVAVHERVLGREGGGRVDPQATEKDDGGGEGEPGEKAGALAPDVDAEEKDERVDRQEIACEQSAAEDGERNPIGDDEQRDGETGGGGERLDFGAWTPGKKQAGDGEENREPDVALPEEMQEACVRGDRRTRR